MLSVVLLKFLALAIEVTEVTKTDVCNKDQPFETDDVNAHPHKIVDYKVGLDWTFISNVSSCEYDEQNCIYDI